MATIATLSFVVTGFTKIIGIRKEADAFIGSYFSENDADSVIGSILEGKMQAELASKLKHIAPVSKVEVRKLEVKSI